MKGLIFLMLVAAPVLGPVARPIQQPDGRFKCAAMCLTTGNADGGYCRTPLVAYNEPTEESCVATLKSRCEKVKPPPGGCRLNDSLPDSF